MEELSSEDYRSVLSSEILDNVRFEMDREYSSESNSEFTSEEVSDSSIDYTESLVSINEKLDHISLDLDYTVTFLLVFGILAFIVIIWRIFYGWFYRGV